MTSTSCKEIAQDTLDSCLAGRVPRDLPRALAEDAGGAALFGVLAEGLADRFEPALCDAYARLFAQAVAFADPSVDAASLVAHYERVRVPRPVAGEPRRVFVLSRVTLGADVAVTSVILAAAKKRFPQAEIVFVGPQKNYQLFIGDQRIRHAEISYLRGGLSQRLAVWPALKELLSAPESVVIDPDSRLTQLGLLPVCPEERYHLFESRGYGGDSSSSLTELAAAWAADTFGVQGAQPYIALAHTARRGAHIAVSLGVGENPGKRIPDPFEEELLRMLAALGAVCIDKGAGGEEAQRVARAASRSGVRATCWDGSFSEFASIIAASKLYVGYDSAGQHVAAACGVPLISVFAGFPAPRTFDRWRPSGEDCRVVRMDQPDAAGAIEGVKAALADLALV